MFNKLDAPLCNEISSEVELHEEGEEEEKKTLAENFTNLMYK